MEELHRSARESERPNGEQCDEGQPRCSQCVRYSESCVYPSAKGSRSSLKEPVESPFHDQSLKELSPDTTGLVLQDLALLHQWSVSTHLGFGDRRGGEKAWQNEVPRQGFEFPFLLRGVLAVTGLHMAKLHPDQSEEYLREAANHQISALPAYRFALKSITERNCHALFAFATLTSVYAFASPRKSSGLLFSGATESQNEGLPEIFAFHRGLRKLLPPEAVNVMLFSLRFSSRSINYNRVSDNMIEQMVWISKGFLWDQLRQTGNVPVNFATNPDDHRLVALLGLVESPISDPRPSKEDLDVYRVAIELLRECYAVSLSPLHDLGAKFSAYRWADNVPRVCLERVTTKAPEALIIVAYMMALLNRAQYWYIEGLPRIIMTEIFDHLDKRFQPWIEWPMEQVGLGPGFSFAGHETQSHALPYVSDQKAWVK